MASVWRTACRIADLSVGRRFLHVSIREVAASKAQIKGPEPALRWDSAVSDRPWVSKDVGPASSPLLNIVKLPGRRHCPQ
jgi:hypothetical protein